MQKLTVVNGSFQQKLDSKKQHQKRRKEIYKDLYFDYKYGYTSDIDIKKAVFYGIKYYSSHQPSNDYKQLLIDMCEFEEIKQMISTLTYNDILNMFPIIKEFDGERFECKDYFTTKQYLSDIDLDSKIGIDNVDELFWEYYNYYIMNFSVHELLTLDHIRKYNGKLSILEQFIKDNGMEEDIHTYTMDKEKNIAYDNVTGESFKIEPTKPRIPKNNFTLVIRGDSDAKN